MNEQFNLGRNDRGDAVVLCPRCGNAGSHITDVAELIGEGRYAMDRRYASVRAGGNGSTMIQFCGGCGHEYAIEFYDDRGEVTVKTWVRPDYQRVAAPATAGR